MAGNQVQVVFNEEQDVQENEKPLADQVIDLYESCLRNGLIISTSFKGVIERRLDPKRRLLQTIFLTICIVYGLPRYSIICFLIFKNEDTRRSWAYYLPDYLEQLGLFGKVLNFCYLVFGLNITVDMMLFKTFESIGRVDYLTNMDTLRDRMRSSIEEEEDPTQFLGEEDKTKLLKGMRTKLLILKNLIP